MPNASTTQAAAVEIIAEGWQQLADAASYYPEDLPAEWQLNYFANEQTGVYLPRTLWENIPPATLRTWRQDVHGRFHFYLEWPEHTDRIAIAACALADSLAAYVRWTNGEVGVLVNARTQASEPQGQALRCPAPLLSDLRGAARWLRQVAVPASATLVILSRPTSTQLADWRELPALLGMRELEAPSIGGDSELA